MNIKYKCLRTKVINNIETKIYFTAGSKKEYVYYKKKYIPIGDYKKIKSFKGGGDKENRAKFLKQVELFYKIIEDEPISLEELTVSPTVSATLGFQGISSPKGLIKETKIDSLVLFLQTALENKNKYLKIAKAQNDKNSNLTSRFSSYRTVNSTNRESRQTLMNNFNLIYTEFIVPYLQIKKFITSLKSFNSPPFLISHTEYKDAIAKLKSLKGKFVDITEIKLLLNDLEKELITELESLQITTQNPTKDIQTAYNKFLLIIKESSLKKEPSLKLAKILKNIEESISKIDVIDETLKQTLKEYVSDLLKNYTSTIQVDNLLKISNIAVKCDIKLELNLDSTYISRIVDGLESTTRIQIFIDIKNLINMFLEVERSNLLYLLNKRIKTIIIKEDIRDIRDISRLFGFYKLLIESETDNITDNITDKIITVYLNNIKDIEHNDIDSDFKPNFLEIIKNYNTKYNNHLYTRIQTQINTTEDNLILFKLILLLRHLNPDSINKHLIKLIEYIIVNINIQTTTTLVDHIFTIVENNSIKIILKPKIQTDITQLIINKIELEETTEQIINKNINTLLLLLYVFNPIEVGNQITLIISKYLKEPMEDKDELYYQSTILKSNNKFYSNTIINRFQDDLINYIKVLRYTQYKTAICDKQINSIIQEKCDNNKLEDISIQDVLKQDESNKIIDITNVITILKEELEDLEQKEKLKASGKLKTLELLKSRSSKSGASKLTFPNHNNTIIENLIILLFNRKLEGIEKDTINISVISKEIPTDSLDIKNIETYKTKLQTIKFLKSTNLTLDHILTQLHLIDSIIDTPFDLDKGKPFITGIEKSVITHTYRKDTVDKIRNKKHPLLGAEISLNEENKPLLKIINNINNKIIDIFPLQEIMEKIIRNINNLKNQTEARLSFLGSDDKLSLYYNLKKLSSFITMFDVSPYLGNADSTRHSGGTRHTRRTRYSMHSKRTSSLRP